MALRTQRLRVAGVAVARLRIVRPPFSATGGNWPASSTTGIINFLHAAKFHTFRCVSRSPLSAYAPAPHIAGTGDARMSLAASTAPCYQLAPSGRRTSCDRRLRAPTPRQAPDPK